MTRRSFFSLALLPFFRRSGGRFRTSHGLGRFIQEIRYACVPLGQLPRYIIFKRSV